MDRLNSVCVVFTCLTFALLICNGTAITRTYFIAAVERTWDYAPTGYNNLKGLKLEDDSDAAVFTTRGAIRIGRVYKKVLYREFEDESFTTEKPHPEYLGFLGPVLKGEVGDTIEVHFKNNGSRVYSVHPHGVFYGKDSEGALYEDSTKGNDKKDDRVPPGGTHTYTWLLTENHAPANQDDNCITWVYHSHVVPSKDVNTGLLGIMLTCKKGALSSQGQQAGVDKEFIGLFTVLDENDSWLLDENIKEYCGNSSTVDRNDEKFMESNKMHAINGYFYGNLFGLDLCLGDSVKWHLAGIGNEVDIHTAYFHGQSFTIDGHRKDVASLLPATFVTATMKAQNLGQWMLNCLVNDHYNAGMYTLFNVTKCPGKTGAVPTVSGSKKRTYFIAANEIEWNYGPSNVNQMDGESLTAPGSDSAVFFEQNNQRIGGTYLKAIYEEYTDATFTTKVEKPAYLGFLGPVIRAEVGDVIEVVFKNNATHNFSIQPHGVFYNKSNEGALYEDGTSGAQKADDSVLPGQTFTYLWTVPEEVGPTLTDAQCITWVYHSSVDPVKDTYSGLIGPLLTCKNGALNDDKTQKVKEFVLLFTVTDESESWYHEKNKKMKANPSLINDADEDYKESNKMHGINGYLYANLPGLEMCWGQAISWHLIGLGNEVDMHTAYFYGNTFTHEGSVKDTVSLLPGVFATLTMTPDNAGEWALVCRTNDHYSAGMQAKYVVRSENCANRPDVTTSGKVRRYYIAAVEIEWDYAPTGMNVLAGEKLEDNEDSRTFTQKTDNRIGRKYKKVVYREYDAQFKKEMSRTTADKHLGVLGPMLHAEVGDTIEVVFKNMASRKYSMHPHGLYYSKSNEGSNYNDNTRGADKADNAIEPGKSYTYTWKVPDRAGPGTDGPACATWAYYSDVDPIKDTNSGLVGPLIICKKGKLKEGSNDERTDVDREFVLLFTVLDENESWYLDENIGTYCRNPRDKEALKGNEDFQESNKMHGINGYVFGNLKDLEMYQDEKVDWLLLGIGNEVDMHTVHFHGQAFLRKQVSYHREDVYDLFPGVFATVEMTPDSVGEWMLHCHVNDHMVAGMETVYSVRDKSLKPTTKPMKPIPGTANSVVAGGVFSCLLSAVVVILLDA